MAIRMNYIGNANYRVITRANALALGLTDPGADLVWSKDNAYKLDVPEDIALLLATQGDFMGDGGLSYGDLVARMKSRSELAYAETTSTFTVAGSPADVPGLGVSVTVIDRPILVIFEGPISNGTTGHGTLVFIYQGASTMIYGNQALGVTNAHQVQHRAVKRMVLAPGVYTFKVNLGRFVAGSSILQAAPSNPAFLQVLEV